jgi:hypothetical protein
VHKQNQKTPFHLLPSAVSTSLVVVAEDLTALTKTLADDLAAGSGRAAGAGTEHAAMAGTGHKVAARI